MASHTVANAKHATLTASTVDTVTFSGDAPQQVEVYNRGSDYIYVRRGGSDPTVAGDDTIAVGAGESVLLDGNKIVKLISASATAYSVHRVDV